MIAADLAALTGADPRRQPSRTLTDANHPRQVETLPAITGRALRRPAGEGVERPRQSPYGFRNDSVERR